MAERLLTHCKVYTLNPAQPVAASLLVKDGRVEWLGDSAEPPAGLSKELIIDDLDNQVVMPSFTDAHIHLLAYGRHLQRVDCGSATRDGCLEAVSRKAAQTPPGKWILGHGWDHNLWQDGAGSVADLDRITSDHPVYLTHKSLHAGWANSAALRLAGISSGTGDPPGGSIQRDKNGDPDGILLESAMQLVEDILPKPGLEENRASLEVARQHLWQAGITSVHDFDGWDCFMGLQAMQADHDLGLRVVKGIPFSHLDEAIRINLRSGQQDGCIMIGWLKLFADGALGSRTAAMLAPFEGSDSLGMLLLNSDDIFQIGSKALSSGITLAVHAIGDRAVHEVLDAYAKLSEKFPPGSLPLPLRMEHAQLVNPQDFPRFKPLGVVASMQPIHAVSDRAMAVRYWGDRCRHAYAWRALHQSGARLVFGSDAPVESPDPLLGLHAALTRKQPGGPVDVSGWNSEQCLDIAPALAAYTLNPQEITRWQPAAGHLAQGSIADLVVLPSDPFSASPDALPGLHPDAVMQAGEWVWKRDK